MNPINPSNPCAPERTYILPSPRANAVHKQEPLTSGASPSLQGRGNLDGEDHAAERTVEDASLLKFMLGTFPGCLTVQLILKRWANQLEICALVLRAQKFYFLVGYSETLLSHFYKCPVHLHLQTVPS
ncbi:hypothetical protein GH733_018847, partial [Mirounga leonina]